MGLDNESNYSNKLQSTISDSKLFIIYFSPFIQKLKMSNVYNSERIIVNLCLNNWKNLHIYKCVTFMLILSAFASAFAPSTAISLSS